MKKSLLILAAAGMATPVFSQGIITFYNNNIINPTTGATYRAGIFQWNGDYGNGNNSTIGAGAGFTAGLFLAGSTTPLATTTFRTTTAQEVFATSQDVIIPGVLPGQNANLVIKAWSTAAGSYEVAAAQSQEKGYQFGEEAFTSKPLGGPNPNPPPPSFFTPDIAPFTGFEMSVAVPEPTITGLALFGASALLLRRRKERSRFSVWH